MAAIPLNTFKTTTFNITTSDSTIYTAPLGITTVILLAQVSNIHETNTISVSANHVRDGNVTSIIKNTLIPTNDATSLLTGKLILQAGDSFAIKADQNNGGQLLLSYLETSNA